MLMIAYENRLPPPFIQFFLTSILECSEQINEHVYTKKVSDVLLNTFDKGAKKFFKGS